MADQNETPKIQIDSDWKAQARAEKERMAKQAPPGQEPRPKAGGAAGQGGMPPASFEILVNTMATQALFAMGAIADPRTGQRIQQMDLARHHIDMLAVIEQKTKGNLTEDESNMLAGVLYELRTRYIQLSSAARGA